MKFARSYFALYANIVPLFLLFCFHIQSSSLPCEVGLRYVTLMSFVSRVIAAVSFVSFFVYLSFCVFAFPRVFVAGISLFLSESSTMLRNEKTVVSCFVSR